jgi:hypothetical protein
MVFRGFLGNEGPDQSPLGSDSRWLVRAVRHLIRQGNTPEGVIVDLIPAQD